MTLVLTLCLAGQFDIAHGESAGAKPDHSAVQISFLPPPVDGATFSLGIYDAKGRLVRRLKEAVSEDAFTAGLNGFITSWDRKDDAAQVVPAGRYSARGFAVTPLKVEGVAFHGNDWVSNDEGLRIVHVEAICTVPDDNGLALLAKMAGADMELLRFSNADGKLLWRQKVETPPTTAAPMLALIWRIEAVNGELLIHAFPAATSDEAEGPLVPLERYRLDNGARITAPVGGDQKDNGSTPSAPPAAGSIGKDKTIWIANGDDGVVQKSADGEVLRTLQVAPGEPPPRWVAASTTSDQIYLLEESDGWQRVRGLLCVEAKEENGQPVSTWQTFFERNIRRPDPASGLEEPLTAKGPSPVVEVPLIENPLSPGKSEKAFLRADFDEEGSYLETADGLRLRKISKRPNLRAVKLVKGKSGLSFFQTDGAAWEEFSIAGANRMMSFDAGEFELTATREKPGEVPPAEP